MDYYCQRNGDKGIVWEKVDEFTFNNHHRCFIIINGNEIARYTGNRISKTPTGEITLDFKEALTSHSLGNVARFLEIKIPQTTIPGGFLREPEFIEMKLRNKNTVHKNGGQTYKAAS